MRTALLALVLAACAAGCSGQPPSSAGWSVPDGGTQVFPQLTLQGLPSASATGGPQAISTWQYHDPSGPQYDLLHVMAICMWCPHCNNETTALAGIAAWRAANNVAAMQIALQGYSGASPTWAEVQKWSSDHYADFPVLIDGQGAQLGQSFDLSAVPVNIVVDPRTMNVLAVDVGDVGDVQSYEQGFLK